MSVEKQVLELMAANDPVWAAVLQRTVMKYVPEDERDTVIAIFTAMRVGEAKHAMQFSKRLGNPRMKAKFLGQVTDVSNLLAAQISAVPDT